MSLMRIAVRMCLVEALKGKTEVGDNVLDSAIGAFQVQADGSLRTDRNGPFLAVYTDAAKSTPIWPMGLTPNGDTEILLEAGVAANMFETNEKGETVVIAGLPDTDETFEFMIDVIMRQVSDVIADPDNTYSELLRGLVLGIKGVEITRAGNASDGVKLAGRQVKLTAELLDDPVMGQPVDGESSFGKFLTAFEAHEDETQAAKAAAMRAMITGQDEDWTATQRYLGLTKSELEKLGLAPLALKDDGTTPEATEATIDIDGRDPDTVTND